MPKQKFLCADDDDNGLLMRSQSRVLSDDYLTIDYTEKKSFVVGEEKHKKKIAKSTRKKENSEPSMNPFNKKLLFLWLTIQRIWCLP